MAASKRQMNTRAATFTPTSGSPTTYGGVTNVGIAGGGSLQAFSGDGDLFNTTVVHDFSDPSVTLTVADFAASLGVGIGARGSLSVTIKDARNQTAGSASGDIVFVASTAIVKDISFGQGYRQFGQANLTFMTESSDGLTSPLSFTVTP